MTWAAHVRHGFFSGNVDFHVSQQISADSIFSYQGRSRGETLSYRLGEEQEQLLKSGPTQELKLRRQHLLWKEYSLKTSQLHHPPSSIIVGLRPSRIELMKYVQEESLRSKPKVLANIEELERLQPLLREARNEDKAQIEAAAQEQAQAAAEDATAGRMAKLEAVMESHHLTLPMGVQVHACEHVLKQIHTCTADM